jgi:hypothetical protein
MINRSILRLCRVRAILFFVLFQLVSFFINAQNACVVPYNPTPAANWGMIQKFPSSAVFWN